MFAFDEREVRGINPIDGSELRNFWGYDPYLHFAPQASYCINPDEGSQITEFRDMVKALHKAGIEVILDVVFNHTAEGNHMGPTISFKGLGNDAYYLLHPTQPQYYMDYSGCGNTVNANHPIVQKFILDCLHYWVEEMHVDGFRFDEGSVLHRGGDGAPMEFPPVVWGIELSEKLADTKMIAEAWDAGGLYDVGQFPGSRWSDWNGRFRDDVRRFVRGDHGLVSTIATRISGQHGHVRGRRPRPGEQRQLHHRARRLHALRPRRLQREAQRRERRGQPRRDRRQPELELRRRGPDGRPGRRRAPPAAAQELRRDPLRLAGRADVRRRRRDRPHAARQQQRLLPGQRALLVRLDAGREQRRPPPVLQAHDRACGAAMRACAAARSSPAAATGAGSRTSAGTASSSTRPSGATPVSRVLAFTLAGVDPLEPDLHVMMNMDDAPHDFAVPADDDDRSWLVFADTAKPSPDDIAEPGQGKPFEGERCTVEGRSIVILESQDS